MNNHSQNKAKPAPWEEGIHEAGLGETIDGFYLAELLNERPVNRLYRVTHPNHDLPMVMKVPRISAVLPPSAYAAFETEVRILSRLHGVYTPKVIGKGDLASCPYIVMEYIEGDTLQQAINQAPVTVERLCEVMIPVCKAVHELHRHNIIHLDIKPGNIHNRANGQMVILDFGTAHHTHMPDMYDGHHEKAPRSFDYVAPEQLHDVRTDSRSDIYALGVILYQLASGKLPFGKADLITVKKRLYLPPTPPRAINNSLPPWLQEIILKCLQRRPDERFTSAKQIAYALAHPNMVALTKRSELTQKPGFIQIARTWLHSRHDDFKQAKPLYPHTRITRAPHVLVALDLDHSSEELKQALRTALWRLAHSDKHCFFTIMTVIDHNELSGTEDFTHMVKREHPTHIHRQMELRHWIQTLKLSKSRINYQVIEGHIASEIIAYAKHHVVDHIVVGARGSSTLRRFMGSVSTKVVAEAPCTVTVVRSRRDLNSTATEDGCQ